jgi:hypothetical protein
MRSTKEVMKLTKGLMTEAEALKLAPEYVAYAKGDFSHFGKIDAAMQKLKKNQEVLTYSDGVFVRAKVASVDRTCFQAVDGPVIRVSNGEYSWRVDGSHDAFPI